MNSIYKMGVELEGGWGFSKVDEQNLGERIKSDGSVQVSADYSGEIEVGPEESAARLLAQVREWYPDKTNTSCGLHIHFSFRSMAAASACASYDFERALIDHLTEWGRRRRYVDGGALLDRLNGRNTFCLRLGGGDLESVLLPPPGREHFTSERRYRAVNWSAWWSHGTMEIRVLPAFASKTRAVEALQEVIDFVDAWATARAGEAVEAESMVPDDLFPRESEEYYQYATIEEED